MALKWWGAVEHMIKRKAWKWICRSAQDGEEAPKYAGMADSGARVSG